MAGLEEVLIGLGIPLFGKYGIQAIVGAVALLLILYLSVELLSAKRANRASGKAPSGETFLNEQSAEIQSDASEGGDADLTAHELGLGSPVTFAWQRLPEAEMLSRSKDFYRQMDQRRTIRFFSSENVPREVIDNVIRTAGTSPSGAHQQPWTFLVITSREVKQQLRNIVEDEEEINYKRRMGNQWVDALRKIGTNWIKPYITEAPYILLVFKKVYSVKPDGSKQVHYYSEHSVSISIGLLLAAIQNAGLYSLTSTPLNCGTAISKLLNRPANEKLIYLMPVGLPATDCTVPDLKRKALNEIATYI